MWSLSILVCTYYPFVFSFIPYQRRLVLNSGTFSETSSSFTVNRRNDRNIQHSPLLHSISSPSSPKDVTTQEWFPADPASTTPQLLSAVWLMISRACDMSRGVRFPLKFTKYMCIQIVSKLIISRPFFVGKYDCSISKYAKHFHSNLYGTTYASSRCV